MLDKAKRIPVAVVLAPVLAVLLALIVGSAFILTVGESPFSAYKVLLQESFGSMRGFATTLQRATP